MRILQSYSFLGLFRVAVLKCIYPELMLRLRQMSYRISNVDV